MKKYFITGLLIWIPLVITLWVLKLLVDVDGPVAARCCRRSSSTETLARLPHPRARR